MGSGEESFKFKPALIRAFTSILCSSALLWSPLAQAYHLDDHKRIALESVAEINHCYPGLIDHAHSYILWASDLDEDTNLFRKDFLYSHFFNPFKHLNMWRYDSSVRISRLESALRKDGAAGNFDGFLVYAHLGHAIHHLQDMTVPAHVVPVEHWLHDGFEVYSFNGNISSGLSCDDLKNARVEPDLNSLLVSVAKKTLSQVAALNVKILRNGEPEIVSGTSFWQPSTNNDFGHYGVLGNHFGQSSFSANGARYVVPRAQAVYSNFKQQQMKAAVRASVLALDWYLVTHGATLTQQKLAGLNSLMSTVN